MLNISVSSTINIKSKNYEACPSGPYSVNSDIFLIIESTN